jgi:hypothetical protein
MMRKISISVLICATALTGENNVTQADVYFGKNHDTLTKRDIIKRKTLELRRK